jgi:RHS repeat-associated protein
MPTPQTYDNMGRVQTVTYPNVSPLLPANNYTIASLTSPITTLTNIYDGSGRPTSVTDFTRSPQYDYVNTVQYGPSGELQTISHQGQAESRTYNNLVQLTNISGPSFGMTYVYSAAQNNGQITQTNSGEQVAYTYDSLNRLISATASGSWGLSFSYDGFGNRTASTPTQGSAPSSSLAYDGSNHIVGGGYDANGNMTYASGLGTFNYDIENRLVSASPSGGGTEYYAYSPSGKRIWKMMQNGMTQEFYLYSIGGQKLSTLTMAVNGALTALDNNVYFGSRLIVSRGNAVTPDRVGSVNWGSRYYPYGEEVTATAQDKEKFATYYRDGTTGLDYAQNRYYASTLGRFLSPDPYIASVGPFDPGSWNRYPYTRGDPINRRDPSGKIDCSTDGDVSDCADLNWGFTGTPTPYCGTVNYFSTQITTQPAGIRRRRRWRPRHQRRLRTSYRSGPFMIA